MTALLSDPCPEIDKTMSADSEMNPKRLCDLVMKGGITSGVVYPLAVCELAKQYNFKNIGGTSAGAIAAAATAAAECARRNNRARRVGFDLLAKLPDTLAEPDRLLSLFTPDRSMRSLFVLATTALKARTAPKIIVAIPVQLLRIYWWLALAIGLIVAMTDRWLLTGLTGAPRLYLLVASILLAIVLFLAIVGVLLYRQITQAIPRNFFGLSKAFNEKVNVATADAPLTNWLTRYLNELAGKPLEEGLLTFGDLYSAPVAPDDPDENQPRYRSINLEMMTTALTHGRPYRLPFGEPEAHIFYFSPAEFSQLFPKQVVDHMIEHAHTGEHPIPHADGCDQLYGFPDAKDLPVVVATRMSLSFPLLLSAVPLYAVDFTLAVNKTRAKPEPSRLAERCWFSDGGLSSNLPIHFFDAPLPRWPTFAINLRQFHPDHQTEAEAVYLTTSANVDTNVVWNRIEKGYKFSNFLSAILNTMQNWQDNTQSRVPGYRDRVVHISQRDNEGGLNLGMMQSTIQNLAKRGKRAGELLVERFAETPTGPAPGWPDQRWVRFRSSIAMSIAWLRRLARGYANPVRPDVPYEALLMRGPEDPPAIYRLPKSDAGRAEAKAVVDGFIGLAARLVEDHTGELEHGPKPTPELRIRPNI